MFLVHIHSGLRWILLILAIYAIFNAYTKWKAGEKYGVKSKMVNLFTLITFHTQLLIGLILYFWNPRSKVNFSDMMGSDANRFFTLEHFIMMLAAVVIITIGKKKADLAPKDSAKHRKIFIFYMIALLIVLAAIPWPFRTALGGGWG